MAANGVHSRNIRKGDTSRNISHSDKKNSRFPCLHKDAVVLMGLIRFIYYLFTIPTEGEIFLFSKVSRTVATVVIPRS